MAQICCCLKIFETLALKKILALVKTNKKVRENLKKNNFPIFLNLVARSMQYLN